MTTYLISNGYTLRGKYVEKYAVSRSLKYGPYVETVKRGFETQEDAIAYAWEIAINGDEIHYGLGMNRNILEVSK